MEEQAAAGPVYRGGEYVASDEEGRPIDPDTYSVGFRRICRQNALPLIRLHDTRATTNSLLEQAGIPDSLRASWLGHTVQINRKSYLAKPKDMTPVSDMIGVIFGAV